MGFCPEIEEKRNNPIKEVNVSEMISAYWEYSVSFPSIGYFMIVS